jgi:hypothetical protein|tara:strand:+ start:439 stop:768 length:330 start_codon:yes stop_codon:yes gene_type:complete
MGLLPGDVETEGTPRAIVRDLDRSDDPRFAETPAGRTAGAFMARDIAAACMTRSDTRGFVLEAVGKFSFDVSLFCAAIGRSFLDLLSVEKRDLLTAHHTIWAKQKRPEF